METSGVEVIWGRWGLQDWGLGFRGPYDKDPSARSSVMDLRVLLI